MSLGRAIVRALCRSLSFAIPLSACARPGSSAIDDIAKSVPMELTESQWESLSSDDYRYGAHSSWLPGIPLPLDFTLLGGGFFVLPIANAEYARMEVDESVQVATLNRMTFDGVLGLSFGSLRTQRIRRGGSVEVSYVTYTPLWAWSDHKSWPDDEPAWEVWGLPVAYNLLSGPADWPWTVHGTLAGLGPTLAYDREGADYYFFPLFLGGTGAWLWVDAHAGDWQAHGPVLGLLGVLHHRDDRLWVLGGLPWATHWETDGDGDVVAVAHGALWTCVGAGRDRDGPFLRFFVKWHYGGEGGVARG